MNRSFFMPGNLSTRFLCYFGNTGDLFVDETLYPQNIEYSLHRLLKAGGYERIVFYGFSKGAYFLDEQSQSLWHGKKQVRKAASLFGDAPRLKGRLTVQTAPDQKNRSAMSFMVGASEMLRYAETFLKDSSIRTAVIFPNGVEALKEFSRLEDGMLLDNFFVQVTAAGMGQQDNTNTAIFLFNRSREQMERILSERARESMNNYLLSPGYSTQHYVGLPGKEELRRLLNFLRLCGDGKNRLQVDCAQLDAISTLIARTAAANFTQRDKPQPFDPDLLQTWLLTDIQSFLKNRFLLPGKPLTLESCRAFCKRSDEAPALERLERLVGMGEVKKTIRNFLSFAGSRKTEAPKEARSRLDRGPKPAKQEKINLHFTFTGNQGSGKTTAAELIGEIFCECGLLATGQTVETTPGELLKNSEYSGRSQQNLISKVEEAMGGVLFIDEAYDLLKPEASGIVTQLLTEMENRKGSFSVVLAGYRNRMEELFREGNVGLESRFKQIVHIEDYTVEELAEIFRRKAHAKGLSLSEELEDLLPTFLHNWYYDKKRSGWANGREMENLLQGMREKSGGEKLLQVSMIPDKQMKYTTDKMEVDAMAAIDSMIGLNQMKSEIRKMRRRRQNGRITGMQHFLFCGPPGTGKTTVGGHMGLILKNMGVLESGHLVEVKPNDLVANYVGQTADKARAVFESARDGVLFIDEAYGLIPHKEEAHDFRGAVIDMLLDYTDPNGKKGPLCIICAGYEKDLEKLLECNEGLARRFKTRIHFESYSPQELLQILEQVLQKEGFQAEEGYLAAAARDFTENIDEIGRRHNAGYIKRYLDASVDLLDERLERTYGEAPVPEAEKNILKTEDAPESGEVL